MPRRGALRQPHRAVGGACTAAATSSRAALQLAGFHRKRCRRALLAWAGTGPAPGTQALRSGAGAHGGAQVHQALGVGGHVVVAGLFGQQRLGQLPQLRSGAACARSPSKASSRDSTRARCRPGWTPFAVAERGNGRRGGAPMPGRSAASAAWRGNTPPCSATTAGRSGAGCAPGCSSPGRSRAPSPRHRAGRGQRLHVGKRCQKARVVRQHGAHLGLLQHDLGQPHAVGVARALPGQTVAARAGAASASALRKSGRRRGRPAPGRRSCRHTAGGGFFFGHASSCSVSSASLASTRFRFACCDCNSRMRSSSPPAACWMRETASMRRVKLRGARAAGRRAGPRPTCSTAPPR
jgi:hypothetical protein